VTALIECGGNGSNPGFAGACGNVRWTGTPLGPLLKELGLMKRSEEVVFYGTNEKVEKIRDKDYPQHFARSLTVEHAMREEVLLACGDERRTAGSGAWITHLRLVVPGWFGIAWVKCAAASGRGARSPFHGQMDGARIRHDPSAREPERSGTVWRETSVCNISIKSVTARSGPAPGRCPGKSAAPRGVTARRSTRVEVEDRRRSVASSGPGKEAGPRHRCEARLELPGVWIGPMRRRGVQHHRVPRRGRRWAHSGRPPMILR
jgi:hypothetical protein